MKRFLRNENGMSAIEFAFVAPVLATIFLGIFSGWSYMQDRQTIGDGVEAASKYVLQGGRDTDKAEQIGLDAWTDKPGDAHIDVTKQCTCGGSASACGQVCGDASIPNMSFTITATGTSAAERLFQSANTGDGMTRTGVVRVR